MTRILIEPITELLSDMAAEGLPVTKALVSRLSPYLPKHIRRFGQEAPTASGD